MQCVTVLLTAAAVLHAPAPSDCMLLLPPNHENRLVSSVQLPGALSGQEMQRRSIRLHAARV
jgi:hypothetical protein